MIPAFDVEIRHDYDVAGLRTDLTSEQVASGFTDHHGYESLGLPSWQDVAECLSAEAEILAQAAQSSAPDGIKEVLDAIDDEDGDGVEFAEFMAAFYGNDIGVAGLSLALSAARGATFYSCSSGLDSHHHAEYPMVGVVPDVRRAILLAELAERAGCGIGQQWGRWYLYAESVSAMHALGKLILEQRDAFDALPEPKWVDGLTEQLERINDY